MENARTRLAFLCGSTTSQTARKNTGMYQVYSLCIQIEVEAVGISHRDGHRRILLSLLYEQAFHTF